MARHSAFLLALAASVGRAHARAPTAPAPPPGSGRALEEGGGAAQRPLLPLGGTVLTPSSLSPMRVIRGGGAEPAERGHGFVVQRDERSAAAGSVLDDGLHFGGHAHGGDGGGGGDVHGGCYGGGGGGSAASAGVSMALFEAEAAWALEEGRAHMASAPHVYYEGLAGAVNRLPRGSRLEAQALAAAGVSRAEIAAARQAEAEAVNREAVRLARAEAVEEAVEEEKQAVEAATAAVEAATAAEGSSPAEDGGSEAEDGADAADEAAADEAPKGSEAAEHAAVASSAADGSSSSGSSGSGGSDRHSGGGGNALSSADEGANGAAAAVLQRVAELKAAAKKAGEGGEWGEALAGYLEACDALTADGEGEGEGEGEEAAATSTKAGKELQACRLNGALCALQTQQWSEAIRLCGLALRANPRSATAHHRRAIALQGAGNLDAALWDLKRAAQLQPSSERFQSALAQAEKTVAARPASAKPGMRKGKPTLGSGGGDDMGEMMRQILSGMGGGAGASPSSGGAAADGLASLFGGGPGGGGGGPDMSSMLSMLTGGSGLGGAASGASGAAAGGDDVSPLEALLTSPLLQASGIGGKGAGKMMGALATFLAYQRRVKKVYRALKPYLPLIFWAVVLWCARPYLLEHVVPFVRPYLPSWAQSCFLAFGAAGAGCESISAAVDAATPVVM